MMIVSDEYIEEWSNRIDKASAKFWDDFFNKHFGKKTMTDTIETINATPEMTQAELFNKIAASKAQAEATVETPVV